MDQDFVVVSHVAEVKSALKSQIKKAAETIRGMMESNAKKHISEEVYDTPPSWYERTGALRNSITTEVTEDGGDTCVVVGTNVEYAAYVELGTGLYATGGSHARKIPWTYKGSDGKYHTTEGAHPRPYLRPAVEKHAEQYKRVLETELKKT
jgi:HK97 gp10 family phage protein